VSKRLFLYLCYYVFTIIISLGSRGGGDGTAALMVVFYSWGLVFARINRFNPVGFLISYFVYLCLLFCFATILSARKKFHGDLILIILYLPGSIIGALIFGLTYKESLLSFLICFVFSAVFVIFFLACDWRLALAHAKKRLGIDDSNLNRV